MTEPRQPADKLLDQAMEYKLHGKQYIVFKASIMETEGFFDAMANWIDVDDLCGTVREYKEWLHVCIEDNNHVPYCFGLEHDPTKGLEPPGLEQAGDE